MKKYCIDTSGLSNPLELLPEDIHVSIWRQVREFLESGKAAVTTEIFGELERLPGEIGMCIKKSRGVLVLEVGDPTWNWRTYTATVGGMLVTYRAYISEYNGGVSKTVGVNDVSIIALAKTLGLPLVSMESPVLASPTGSPNKRRIPDICKQEAITHYTFNDLLRLEGIQG